MCWSILLSYTLCSLFKSHQQTNKTEKKVVRFSLAVKFWLSRILCMRSPNAYVCSRCVILNESFFSFRKDNEVEWLAVGFCGIHLKIIIWLSRTEKVRIGWKSAEFLLHESTMHIKHEFSLWPFLFVLNRLKQYLIWIPQLRKSLFKRDRLTNKPVYCLVAQVFDFSWDFLLSIDSFSFRSLFKRVWMMWQLIQMKKDIFWIESMVFDLRCCLKSGWANNQLKILSRKLKWLLMEPRPCLNFICFTLSTSKQRIFVCVYIESTSKYDSIWM